MAGAHRLAHELPGEPRLRDRVAAAGMRFDAVAENVGYSTRVEQLHSNFMGSPEHRENLLSSRYDTIGIAILQSGDRYWVTQDFAHATSEASGPEAEDDFADAIAALRRRRGLAPMSVGSSAAPYACSSSAIPPWRRAASERTTSFPSDHPLNRAATLTVVPK